jgi:hypothetical protein
MTRSLQSCLCALAARLGSGEAAREAVSSATFTFTFTLTPF